MQKLRSFECRAGFGIGHIAESVVWNDDYVQGWVSLLKSTDSSNSNSSAYKQKKTVGVFICSDCAGSHRKLGTHITTVKSVDYDSFQDTG